MDIFEDADFVPHLWKTQNTSYYEKQRKEFKNLL